MNPPEILKPDRHGAVPKNGMYSKLVLIILFVFHICAVFLLLPPTELFNSQPILGADHPAHAHRVLVYRNALYQGDAPWGYDPSVCGGVVMRPTQDAGAKPQEVIGAMLPWLTEGQVLRHFLFLTALFAPLWSLLACRLLQLSPSIMVWNLFMVLASMWLYLNFAGFLRWGLTAFAFSSYLAPLVLASFQVFFAHASWRHYFLVVALLAFQAFLHVLGPVILAPVICFEAVFASNLSRPWRLAALLIPLVVALLNAFWLVPFVADFAMTPNPPGRDFTTYPADLVYHSWDHMLAMLAPMRVVVALLSLFLVGIGFFQFAKLCGKRTAVAFLAAGMFGVLLKFFGSFIPVVVMMQPSRFLLTGASVLALPLAMGTERLCRLLRIPNSFACGLATLLVIGTAGWKDRQSHEHNSGREHVNFAGNTEIESTGTLGLPRSIPTPDFVDALTIFVARHTNENDRILLQTRAQCEGKILAAVWRREVIGNAYPDQNDPANFLTNRLFGREISSWSSGELKAAIGQWGINWVFTCTDEAAKLFERTYEKKGIQTGIFRGFYVSKDQTRFLIGEGTIETKVNRIILQNLKPNQGKVVVRYRYHPAWSASNESTITGFDVPGASNGFLLIKPTAPSVELTFSPTAMFTAGWPALDKD